MIWLQWSIQNSSCTLSMPYVINFVFVVERIKGHVTYIVKILWIFRFIVLFVCLFGSNPVRDSDFFLCSTLMTCWLFHLHSNKVISIIIIWAWLKLFHCKWPRWRSTTLKNICFMTNKHVKTTYDFKSLKTIRISLWNWWWGPNLFMKRQDL